MHNGQFNPYWSEVLFIKEEFIGETFKLIIYRD